MVGEEAIIWRKEFASVQFEEGLTFQSRDVILLTSFLPMDPPGTKEFPKTL